jgi:hypothetical protein
MPWLRGGQPPWHMWGTTQLFQFTPPGFAPPQTHQLVKIAYGRPETWSFMFHGRLTGGSVNGSGSAYQVIMRFSLIFGVGRSSANTDQPPLGSPLDRHAFAKLVWEIPNGATPGQIVGQDNTKFTSEVLSPVLDDRFPLVRQAIQWIPSQDIQVWVEITSGGEFQTVTGEASAYFAPRSHVRPDWLQLDVPPEAQFAGSEIGGR